MDMLETPEEQSSGVLSVLVLGGYGLIGSAVMRRLTAAGHRVIGVGRSGVEARRSAPDAEWDIFDIATMSVEGWQITLRGVDVVVNASGALQSGARDDLKGIHETALVRIGEAMVANGPNPPLFVQISAAGVSPDASTEFFRSKARGEAAFQALGLPMVTLRPSLVLAPAAYGGTALLRAAAALPFVLPKVLPESKTACVHIDDLAQAALDAAEGRIAAGTTVDVTGAGAVLLPDLIARMRAWLGILPAWIRLPVPHAVLTPVSRLADLAGWLGWRSPLRRSAIRVLQDGTEADPDALARAGGTPCRDIDAIFRDLPASLQERWFARAYLLFPLTLLTLSLFWIASGVIGLISFPAAQSVLTSRGWSAETAGLAVIGGAIIDIALGTLVLWRSKLKRALLGMIAVSLAYLVGATLTAPDLWADPLGPLVKVIPGLMLALIALALSDER
ncbi:MAG: SDR family oxidoreductase [Silicimonas sp.]|nr:SDR family oxidoreductase [Silicimonas sp.]